MQSANTSAGTGHLGGPTPGPGTTLSKQSKAGFVSRALARTKLARNIVSMTFNPHRKPTNLILYVTSYCGAKCPMCFVKGLNTGPEPTMDQIREVSAFYPKPMSGVALTGGDPFLRKELPEIAKLFWDNNRVEAVHIPSNGLIPETHCKAVRKILETTGCEVTVAISLDATGATYDEIRGVKGNFPRTMETYDRLAKMTDEFPRLKIAVNTVVSNMSYPTISDLIQFVRTRMPKVWMHDFDLIRGEPLDPLVTLPPMEDLLKLRPLLRENYDYYLNRMGAALKKYQLDLNLMVLQKNQQIPKCKAAETYLVVDQYANVAFCELTAPVGNLNKARVEDIWKSPIANARRESIHRGDCFCTHGCFQPLNILYTPLQSAIPVLKEAIMGDVKLAPELSAASAKPQGAKPAVSSWPPS